MRFSLAALGFVLAASFSTLAHAPKDMRSRSLESLLPADCVAYFSYDGYAAHRQAYDKTALAKVMKEDVGDFLEHLFTQLATLVAKTQEDSESPDDQNPPPANAPAAGAPALNGPPANGPIAKAPKGKMPEPLPKFVDYLWQNGVAMGIEARPNLEGKAKAKAKAKRDMERAATALQGEPMPEGAEQEPDEPEFTFQLTLIFPDGGSDKNLPNLVAFLSWLTTGAGKEVQQTQHGKHWLWNFKLGEYAGAWWREENHLVLSVGTEPVQATIDVAEGKRRNLTTAPLFRKTARFTRYESDMRGFVDIEKIVAWLAQPAESDSILQTFKDKMTRQIVLSHLGLTGLKDLTFHLGFDRQYQRSTINLHVVEPKKRQGLLKLVTGPIPMDSLAPKERGQDSLPPLPPDADYVSVRHLDWESLFDYIQQSYRLVALGNLLEGDASLRPFPDLDAELGINFRKDFLAQLEPTFVTYGAHSEGPFFLGQALAVKVKDAAKVRAGMDAIAGAFARAVLNDASGQPDAVQPEKKTYRGAEMCVFSKFPLPLSYTVHKDWLVMSLFPQPVQGFIRRSEGKYRTWKAPPELREAYAIAKKEGGAKSKLLAVTVSDPRPAIDIGLSLMPAFVQTLNQTAGTKLIDVDKIPSAQAINEWLFPNVTLMFDDGDAIRWENHYSINEPDTLIGPMMALGGLADFLPLGGRWTIPFGAPRPLQMGGPPVAGIPVAPPANLPLPAEFPPPAEQPLPAELPPPPAPRP